MTFLKGAVLALVLANIGYFLWSWNIAGQGSTVEPAAAPRIRLASEAGVVPHEPAGEPQGVEGAAGVARGEPPSTHATGGGQDDQSAALLSNLKRCVTVGPFRDVGEAVRAATSLRAAGYAPRQRVAEGEVPAGVWVYLPRPADPAATGQLLERLKKAGIEDALEMSGPAETPVISLGLFSEPRRAQARVGMAKGLGLAPVVADRKRSANVFWVDMDLESTESMPSAADLPGSSGNRIMRLEVKSCSAP